MVANLPAGGRSIDDVANQIRKWRLDEVDWWTSSATSPADTEEALLSRGATVVDIVYVLAYGMSADGVARLWGAATRPPW